MKKLKKNQQARVQKCKEKVESFLRNRIKSSDDKRYISEFTSEWINLTNLFDNRLLSLKDFEKKVSYMCLKWEEKLSNS